MAVNTAQRDHWNEVAGPKWIRFEALLEANLTEVAALLLREAAPRAGERVLEIGCGTGTLASRLAEAVGPAGSVTGVDISATMLNPARGRVPDTVRLVVADGQTEPFEAVHDLVVSRFGVMFFADPVAAFANLRTALRPGGRLCFVCWSGMEENAHWREAAAVITRHLGPLPPREPDAPGPMAFADPARVRRLLGQAGFTQVSLRTEHPDLLSEGMEDAVEIGVGMGPGGAFITESAPDAATLAAIRAGIAKAYAPYLHPAGVRLPASVHMVTATA